MFSAALLALALNVVAPDPWEGHDKTKLIQSVPVSAASRVGNNNVRGATQPQWVDGPMRLDGLYPGVQPWTTLPDSRLWEVPVHTPGIIAQLVSHHVQPLVNSFSCPLVRGCEVVIYLYDCPTCRHEDGGLRAVLAQEGFRQVSCAPRFTLTHNGFRHRMAAYVKTFFGQYVLTTPAHQFGIIAMLDHFACEANENPGACTAMSRGGQQCYWNTDHQSCKLRYCPRPTGPFDKDLNCKVCPLDELIA